MKQEKLLNWLKSEKSKDQTELDSEKKRFADQLLKLKKEDLPFKISFETIELLKPMLDMSE